MYKILDNEDLDKLMNLPEDELNSFLEIKIPDSNIIADPLQENVQVRFSPIYFQKSVLPVQSKSLPESAVLYYRTHWYESK